jgi:hypothetical protein
LRRYLRGEGVAYVGRSGDQARSGSSCPQRPQPSSRSSPQRPQPARNGRSQPAAAAAAAAAAKPAAAANPAAAAASPQRQQPRAQQPARSGNVNPQRQPNPQRQQPNPQRKRPICRQRPRVQQRSRSRWRKKVRTGDAKPAAAAKPEKVKPKMVRHFHAGKRIRAVGPSRSVRSIAGSPKRSELLRAALAHLAALGRCSVLAQSRSQVANRRSNAFQP